MSPETGTTDLVGTDLAGTDLMGTALTDQEQQLLQVYATLRLLARDGESPCLLANARTALAPVAVAVTSLGLKFEHLLDEGC